MVHKNTAGFTLIELILALAISASLSVIAFAGFSQTRGQAEFTNAIDGLKEQVVSVRTEALTTVNLGTSGGLPAGTTPGEIVLGRVLTFTPGGSTVTVGKVVATNSTTPNVLRVDVDHTFTVPWGVVYAGQFPIKVGFIRSGLDGSNITAVGLSSAWGNSPSYANLSTPGSLTTLSFKDPSGRLATIDIDPVNNSIGRTYP